MRIIEVDQGSPEWHALRNRSVGASDWATILGLNPYKTQHMLWEEKLGLRTIEQTLAMKKGHEVEDEARSWFHKEYGRKVKPCVALHDNEEWALSSFDGIDLESLVILEIKRVKEEYHEMACCGKVPELYYPQLQAQMYVADADNAHYLSYKKSNPAIVIVPRDNDFIANAIPKLKEFWRCVIDLIPPPLTDRDYIDVSDDFHLAEMAQRYKYYQSLWKEYESKCDALKDEMRVAANDRNVKGEGFRMSKYAVKGRVLYDSIPELQGVNLEPYRKAATTSYRITVE